MSECDKNRGLSAVPWDSSVVYVILSCSLIGVMGVPLISPVLPEFRVVFGVSNVQVGLVITVYTLPGIVLSPFVGVVADRIGRRRVVAPLLFVFGIGGAGVSFATSFAEVLALRFLQGVGASALITLAVTLIGDVYDGTRRDAVMGLNGSAIGIGAALYPMIGGLLAAIRWTAPFLFFGVSVFVGLAATVVLVEPETVRSTNVRECLVQLRTVALLPRALTVLAAMFAAFFVFFGAIHTTLPLLLSDEFDLSASQIGPIIAMVPLAGATVSSQYGRIAGWRHPPELIAIAFVAYGAGLLGVWLAPSPVFIGVALFVFGIGNGLVIPSVDTVAVTLVSDQLRAGMMGLRGSMFWSGQTLGPVGFTLIAEAAFDTSAEGYRILLFVCGTIVLIVGSAAYLLMRR